MNSEIHNSYILQILLKMSSINEIKEIWKIADAVTFDVDSTVIQEEGIDELAKFCGKGDQVTSL